MSLERNNRPQSADLQVIGADEEIPKLPEQTLYACWDGEHWVIMLPSEY